MAQDATAAMQSCLAQADGGGPETSTRPRFPGNRLHTMLPKRRVQPEVRSYRHAFGSMSKYEQPASILSRHWPLRQGRRRMVNGKVVALLSRRWSRTVSEP